MLDEYGRWYVEIFYAAFYGLCGAAIVLAPVLAVALLLKWIF